MCPVSFPVPAMRVHDPQTAALQDYARTAIVCVRRAALRPPCADYCERYAPRHFPVSHRAPFRQRSSMRRRHSERIHVISPSLTERLAREQGLHIKESVYEDEYQNDFWPRGCCRIACDYGAHRRRAGAVADESGCEFVREAGLRAHDDAGPLAPSSPPPLASPPWVASPSRLASPPWLAASSPPSLVLS